MPEPPPDTIARTLASGLSRRRLIAGLAAFVLPVLTPARTGAACKKVGKRCDKDNDCCGGAECADGACACKPDRDACGGPCSKLATDERHCGACGNACGQGTTCKNGTCAAPGYVFVTT